MKDENMLWQIRRFVYQHFADIARAPRVDETASRFKISVNDAGAFYTELNNRHAFFLEPNTLDIRMAFPFSAAPTDFTVQANGKTYFANCAWDMLGIPTALHCDALIDAKFSESNEPVQLEVKEGKVTNGELLIHFPLPFTRWYDDLVFT